MKRLLVVSYAFPPQRNAESLLVLAAVRGLVRAGWAITVLTVDVEHTSEPLDPDLLEQIPSSVSVVRTRTFQHWLSGLPRLRRAFWYSLRVLGLPEQQCTWYFSATKMGRRLLATKPFDVMHSWANYPTSNVVALRLKRDTRIPWVAHFSDPWIDNPGFFPHATPLQLSACASLERQIIAAADTVVFTTDECARLVFRKYPEPLGRKARIVPHGYDLEALPDTAIEPHPHRESARPMRMVHTGSLYPGRDPICLLNALATLHGREPLTGRLELHLVGPGSEDYQPLVRKLHLESVVELTAAVGRRESLLAAIKGDVLVVIDAPADDVSVFLPSKLVDYLMLQRTILGITPARSATARVLSEIGFPCALAGSVSAIAEAVGRLLTDHEGAGLNLPTNFECTARNYSIDATTQSLNAVLDEAVFSGNRIVSHSGDGRPPGLVDACATDGRPATL